MAFLRFIGVVLAIVSTACSLTLDPDELHAQLKTADATSTTEVVDSTSGDTVGDTTTTPPDSTSTTTDTAIEEEATGPQPNIVFHYSGEDGGCDLNFYFFVATGCPMVCGLSQDWTLAIDASNSTNVDDFKWKFRGNDGYIVSPNTGSGARVDNIKLSLPACAVGNVPEVGDSEVTVDLSIDGGHTYDRHFAIPFTVNQQGSPTCSDAGVCAAP